MELSNPQHEAKVLDLVDQSRIMTAVERMTLAAEHPQAAICTMTQRDAYIMAIQALFWAINQPSGFEAFMMATDAQQVIPRIQ